ncbi:MAG: glycosyltransferase, partial [Planctomycetes bacterium]|nr:glycosyltransferase [Planctomycetota bacterium]
MDRDLVSVVMPVRRAGAPLRRALRSILRQTYARLELIAVDDATTEEDRMILADAARTDGRIRVVPSPGCGIVAALDAGIAAARGSLLARMDADDIAHPERIRRQVDLLSSRQDVAVASCRVRIFPRRILRGGNLRYEAWLNALIEPEAIAREFFIESPIPHPSILARREAFDAAGGYADGPFPEDYDLWLRMHLAGLRFAKVPAVLLLWRESPGRLSRIDPRYAHDAFLERKAFYLARGPLRDAGRAIVWGAGPIGKSIARALAANGIAIDAF